ncbi:MAG TPA: hypothetical protein VMU92_07990 [Acidobacteriaceae bacterium]|nr:hypothetical protein [Acidobacteriaceae bacterium]
MKKTLALLAATVLLLTAGCRVQVDKNSNGADKNENVKIDTPFGGLHVRSGQTTAADVGLPVYPGATIAPDRHGDKSADVHMGFGSFQLMVKVVNYETSDPADKVLAFYQKALGRYGDVIRCKDDSPVGTPTITSEGLTCSDDYSHTHVQVSGNLSLKAGSKHHQHVVAVEDRNGLETRFALIELQLPESIDQNAPKSQ